MRRVDRAGGDAGDDRDPKLRITSRQPDQDSNLVCHASPAAREHEAEWVRVAPAARSGEIDAADIPMIVVTS